MNNKGKKSFCSNTIDVQHTLWILLLQRKNNHSETTLLLNQLAHEGKELFFFGYIIPTILSLKVKLSEKVTHMLFLVHILSGIIKAIDTWFG